MDINKKFLCHTVGPLQFCTDSYTKQQNSTGTLYTKYMLIDLRFTLVLFRTGHGWAVSGKPPESGSGAEWGYTSLEFPPLHPRAGKATTHHQWSLFFCEGKTMVQLELSIRNKSAAEFSGQNYYESFAWLALMSGYALTNHSNTIYQ